MEHEASFKGRELRRTARAKLSLFSGFSFSTYMVMSR